MGATWAQNHALVTLFISETQRCREGLLYPINGSFFLPADCMKGDCNPVGNRSHDEKELMQ